MLIQNIQEVDQLLLVDQKKHTRIFEYSDDATSCYSHQICFVPFQIRYYSK